MRRREHDDRVVTGRRLADVSLAVTRWTERVLAANDPPLTITEFAGLSAIAAGNAAPGDLAQLAGVSDAAISQLLRALERDGLVQRALAQFDRRRHMLRLTRSGEHVLHMAGEAVAGTVGGLLEPLPPHELRLLDDILAHVGDALAGTRPPRRGPPPPPGPRSPRRP